MSGKPLKLDMHAILSDKANRVVVCCGAGGVGKTTTAAAMALRAAEYGRTVVVLTIDPAKRLAQALGIKDLGNTPQRVPLAPEVPGELYAMMLDMRRTFDEMVLQYSGEDRADAILENQFYQTVATSLSGTQEYMAMEKLGQLLAEDKWDLVVVDTPPSRNALDFLDAPKRLGNFMDSRLWRLLLGPGRGIGRLVTGAMGLAMKALSTVLGSQMLSDAAGFVQSLDATFGGFREKADRTYELLNDIPGVSCVKPMGALYAFPKIDPKVCPIHNDEKFVLDLLLSEKLLIVQGTAFNWPWPDHFRVVTLPRVDELEQAIGRIGNFLKGYSQ